MKKLITCLFILISLLLVSCSEPLKIQYTSPIYAMGTTIEITFYNTDNYEKHYREVKKIYNDYNLLADIDGASNCVGVLNKNRSIEASAELKDLISFAIEMKEKTNGYFNPLIGNLTALWKKTIETKELPTEEKIASEVAIMNSSSINIEGSIISISGEANIDLGAIAKGYATEKAKEYLKNNNINNYLINAGSSNVVLGSKNNENFKAFVTAPYEKKNIIAYEGQNKDIITSSGAHQNVVIDNARYHHLINPFNGYPANNFDSVSVLGNDSALGDAYSTAIFVMSLDNAKEFAKNNNIDILLYKDGNIIYKTEGWS